MKAKYLSNFVALTCFSAALAADRVSLDGAWQFALDGAKPRTVSVPHDWSIEAAPKESNPSGGPGGYYPGGVGVYTRTFDLAAGDIAKDLELVFDGAYRDASVEVNGVEVGKGTFYGYTGFTLPLGKEVRAGENTLKVTVRNEREPNCRWYAGSGLFRHVWLVKWEKGKKVDDIAVSTALDGSVTITGTVGGKQEKKDYKIENPVLWTPETPKLYTFDFFGEEVRTGIRTVAVDKDRGLLLNGKSVKLHGACVHHDNGPLGAASYDEAEIRKVRQLKRAGFNAVRTSHNPVSAAFLDACDAEGLVVIDDMFDGWRSAKNGGDYSSVFAAEHLKDLSWIVKRDRVHPSVCLWSIGNEILERTKPQAVEDSRGMAARCHELDPQDRPVTMALCCWFGEGEWLGEDKLAATLDVAGYNYMEHMTEKDRERCPDRVIVYTETYPKDAVNVWRRIQKHGYVIGEFVWTGIDYLGESAIGRAYYKGREPDGESWQIKAWPRHGASCGDIDLTGWRKPISHKRETLWNPKAPTVLAVREPNGWKGEIKTTMWSVWPTWRHWTFPGWEGKTITAEVYSRADKVRLAFNGKVIAEKSNSAENAWTTTFELPYQPGELAAVGLLSDGTLKDCSVLKTAGAPASVRYTTETIGSLSWVTAEVVDKDGVVCPWAEQDVTFEGNVIATCSDDLRDTVRATSRTRRTSHGRALAVVSRTPAARDGIPDFHDWAKTPPMGWNSWDFYGTSATEAQMKAQADVQAEKLLKFGYDTCTLDITWYDDTAGQTHAYNDKAPLELDEYGRLIPGPKRFPSSAGGKGLKPLADYIHSKGLKFGIHIMRGIARQAVERNCPVKGANGIRAKDIANTSDTCPWNPHMYGVDMKKPGAQAYYDSLLELYAQWGVDFIKCDDIARPYSPAQTLEIEALRKAIDKTGRPIVLSLSPGDTPLSANGHVEGHANMWRISDDFWDRWEPLHGMFGRLHKWEVSRVPGAWPDADMLPFGNLAFGRKCGFTPDEQRTCMTLWCIARSPLILGGDMTTFDDATYKLVANPDVLAVNQKGANPRQLSRDDNDRIVWVSDAPDGGRYVALFNAASKAGEGPASVSVRLADLGISGWAYVRDLWSGRTFKAQDSLSADLPCHAAALFHVK